MNNMENGQKKTVDIPNKLNAKELKNISKNFGIRLNKKKGQCFLIDKNIAKFMAENAVIKNNNQNKINIILEIGPGYGIITDFLLNIADKVICIEIDYGIIKFLKQKYSRQLDNSKLKIIDGDAIKIEFPPHNALISNTPFHISGPLLQKIILTKNPPQNIVLMLQKEFIRKLQSTPNPNNYGRLSVVGDLFFDIKYLKKVSINSFFPKPNVECGIVQLKFKKNVPPILSDFQIRKSFLEFLSGIFPYKNKTSEKAFKFFLKRLRDSPELFPAFSQFKLNSNIFDPKQIVNNVISIMQEENCQNKRIWEISPQKLLSLFKKLIEQQNITIPEE
ncbi:MAG: 16S rRNA (adenine(1518)-N(6)/adenine(1519)-N(6))-dimethyltransferase RsmA [Promethearchaeota archaeon]